MKRILCIALVLVILLSGCGSSQAPQPSETYASVAQETISSPNALRLTQESNVRKATYEGKTAYSDFLELSEKLFLIPGLKQVLTPQGIAVCPNSGRTYISAYSVDDIPSVVMVTEASSHELVAEYYLYNADGTPFTSHVGGIALTNTHLYLSDTKDANGNYRIAAIPLNEFPQEGAHDITVTETIIVAVSPSMMNFSNGYLWIGNFYHPSADYNLSPNLNYTTIAADGSEYGCYILGYDMQQGHERLLATDSYPLPDIILAAPNRIQGITLTDSNTVVLSQSYGRANDSTILVYNFNPQEQPDLELTLNSQLIPTYLLDNNRLEKSINSIPMSEGLTTTPDGRVYVLYESGAIRYQDGKHRTSYVWTMMLE